MTLLNYNLLKSNNNAAELRPTLVLLHGLFGDKDNLKILANTLTEHFDILMLDLRNHGNSFHSEIHDYSVLATDVIDVIAHLNLKSVSLIGHSMGGKVAMRIASLAPRQVEKLAILDIAPVKYEERRHDDVLLGLNKVVESGAVTRKEAHEIMQKHLNSQAVIQFLLKSFVAGKWRFNLSALEKNYEQILDWQPINQVSVPTLFIIGSLSNYVTEAYRTSITTQFPNAKAHIIHGAEHWVHADKPIQVGKALSNFLLQ